MSDQPQRPHDEKAEEKEEEKRHEKGEKDEKNWEEKWRRDPLGTVVWALILIWAGVAFLLENMKVFQNLRLPGREEPPETWAIILVGAGVILLLEIVVRLTIPAYRRPVGGTFILGVILIAVGLGQMFGWNLLWPVVLIAIGVSILLGGLLRHRQT